MAVLPPDVPSRRLVQNGYDAIAEDYLASKDADDPVLLAYLSRLAQSLGPAALVLDLGCGAGVPATRWLAERFPTIGVDLSRRQLELARTHAPGARLVQADLAELDFRSAAFDAIVSFHAIIHVPRQKHAALIARIFQWLKPGGAFLATWPLTAWEGTEANWEGWGVPMGWSHFGRDDYLRLLGDAGFAVETAEAVQETPDETCLWVRARRP